MAPPRSGRRDSGPDVVATGGANGTTSSGSADSGEPAVGAADLELPEPAELAALLLAIEADRRELLNRVASGFEEEVEAVARLYWPFLLVRGQDSPGAAVFDLAGVWKQSLTYSFVPEPSKLEEVLGRAGSPEEFFAQVRTTIDTFARNSRSETLTVEGFLPLAPPLQLELLSQTLPHAEVLAHASATLPTRRPVGWYREEVARMRQWLVRLDSDLQALRGLQLAAERSIGLVQAALDQHRAAVDAEALERLIAARTRAHAEIERIQQAHHAEVLRHLGEIDGARRTLAVEEVTLATRATLSERASTRREDPSPHHARAREARLAVRSAKRKLADSQHEIESIHARQRWAQEQALAEVTALERSNSLACATHDLLQDQLNGTASVLRQCLDGQIATRQAQKESLGAFFLPLPAPVASKVVWLPVWVATFRSPRGSRQIVFPPFKQRSRIGVGGSLKRLFGGVVLPVEPRTSQFDKEFRTAVQPAMARDPWLSEAARELTEANSILGHPEVLSRLKEGLEQLRRNGWISAKQASEFRAGFVQSADRRKLRGRLPAASSEPVVLESSGSRAAAEVASLALGESPPAAR